MIFFLILRCHLFLRLARVISSKPVYLPCVPSSSCVVIVVRPDRGIPVGRMTVFAIETLIRAWV